MSDTLELHPDDLKLIARTRDYVKETLANAEGGHDWFHILRVYKNALRIAKSEKGADVLVVALAALLHDIADSKFHGGDEQVGPRMAEAFLKKQQLEAERSIEIVKIIENVSYRGGHKKSDYTSLELLIVQDADRLDAIGAVGIARTFNYGGFKNRKLYDPALKPNPGMSVEAYKKSDAPTINHFYEKLLLLKDQMHTTTAQQIAAGRHEFMEDFLAQFYAEWDGLR